MKKLVSLVVPAVGLVAFAVGMVNGRPRRATSTLAESVFRQVQHQAELRAGQRKPGVGRVDQLGRYGKGSVIVMVRAVPVVPGFSRRTESS